MKLSHFRFIAAVCLLVTNGAGVAFSQQAASFKKDDKAAPQPLEIKANLLVRGDAESLAGGLKAEEIKIFEDGVEQKITRLTRKDPPLRLGLVMDNSSSVRNRLETNIKIGETIIANLKPDDETFIMRFVSSDKITVAQDWTKEKSVLVNALNELYVEGGSTALVDSVYISAKKMQERAKDDESKRYALVLISDGEDLASYYREEQLFNFLKENQIQVFPLVFTAEAARPGYSKKIENFVSRVAFESGGAAFLLTKQTRKESDAEILAALNSIAAELRSQYVVQYVSTNQKRDGQARKLTVQIADGARGEKRHADIRQSFVVPNR